MSSVGSAVHAHDARGRLDLVAREPRAARGSAAFGSRAPAPQRGEAPSRVRSVVRVVVVARGEGVLRRGRRGGRRRLRRRRRRLVRLAPLARRGGRGGVVPAARSREASQRRRQTLLSAAAAAAAARELERSLVERRRVRDVPNSRRDLARAREVLDRASRPTASRPVVRERRRGVERHGGDRNVHRSSVTIVVARPAVRCLQSPRDRDVHGLSRGVREQPVHDALHDVARERDAAAAAAEGGRFVVVAATEVDEREHADVDELSRRAPRRVDGHVEMPAISAHRGERGQIERSSDHRGVLRDQLRPRRQRADPRAKIPRRGRRQGRNGHRSSVTIATTAIAAAGRDRRARTQARPPRVHPQRRERRDQDALFPFQRQPSLRAERHARRAPRPRRLAH
eukprot:29619-Pelagococcus_subviridis.AAC.4